ncbi:MAG TPA: sigma-54-dependent Fis family transcriptional regulator [Candidatus Aminicenantes bacterium]|nr:sigma-54-dependent Fis family transcriptional regulator [Candidatus Aminicenantes bacterium]HRY66345.1 sigma-54-dependent Fis family transcriptional regulator [Candidatus Aminicenantes bacterium]HRZ73272.1 sigma-54-dependent Fis family transcriptional regulator [Candidatus Aminicenantes bacterium]
MRKTGRPDRRIIVTPQFLSRVAEVVFDHVDADLGVFRAFDAKGEPAFEARRGFDGTPDEAGVQRDGEALAGRALEIGRPVLVPDLRREPLFADLEFDGDGRRPRSVLAYPWIVRGRPAGLVLLVRRGQVRPFDGDAMEFLTLALAPVLYLLRKNGGPAPPADPTPPPAPGISAAAAFLGDAPAVRRVRAMIERVRDTDAPVFIAGESGTGKELAAKILHDAGRRRGGPFVAVNCAAIPEALLESELFGHARGSFTGAFRDKTGLVEEASGGTFFLDEIGDLPLALQAKLLRVLEEKTVRRVGETRPRPVDVRFVSATNKDLEAEVERGRFRQDLFYRLKIIAIDLPPLRERPDDAHLLLNHFLEEFARSMGRPRPFVSPVALEMLVRYPWPGNVRELQNEVQRLLVMAGGGPLILEEHLSPKINPAGETHVSATRLLAEARADFERRFLREALVRCRYHRTRTAAEIGLTRQGLFKLLKKHGLEGRTG